VQFALADVTPAELRAPVDVSDRPVALAKRPA
jgi:hypothetical protein